MIIYEKLKCEDCGEVYKGKFKINVMGFVSCYDCNNKEVVGDLVIKEVSDTEEVNQELEQNLVSQMLLDDIERIYKFEAQGDEDFTQMFFTEDGSINAEKLYFMGNPIDLVVEGQKIAYSALRYLEGDNRKYRNLSQKLIDTYKNFREIRLSTEEVLACWELYKSEEVLNFLRLDMFLRE